MYQDTARAAVTLVLLLRAALNSITPTLAGRSGPSPPIFAERGIANGGTQQHYEYVVFDRSQVYPEYVVHYRV